MEKSQSGPFERKQYLVVPINGRWRIYSQTNRYLRSCKTVNNARNFIDQQVQKRK